jgi:hypothetical protein
MIAHPAFVIRPEQERATSIVGKVKSEDYWIPSDNDYDWLGTGTYFFQDAPIRALLFAEKRVDELKARGVDGEPAVIRAQFKLGVCLDLLDAEAATYIKFVHRLSVLDGRVVPTQFQPKCRTNSRPRIRLGEGAFRPAGTDINHLLDRYIIGETIKYLEGYENTIIDSVRCAFIDGYPLCETSWMFDLSHVQVCIRNVRKCLIRAPNIADLEEIKRCRYQINARLEAMNRRHDDVVDL